MRIGIDIRSLIDQQPSGVGTYVWHIVKNLVELAPEHDFMLFFSGWQIDINQNDKLSALAKYKNVQLIYWRWPNKLFHGLAMFGLAPKLDKIVGGVDVWFAPNLHFLPLSKNIPLVLTAHDLSFALFPEFLSWRRQLWHKAVCSHYLFKRANKLVAVSNTTKHDLEQVYKILPDKIMVVYPGVPEIEPVNIDATNQLAEKLPLRYVLLLATLEPRKNVLASLAAWQHFCELYPKSDLHLVVTGSAGWKSQNILQTMGITPRAHYFGYVTEAQKAVILQQAEGLLYPSIYEGFGFPPLEALRLGVPVIASHVGALPEVLGEAALYVDPYSINDLVQALENLNSSKAMRENLLTARTKTLARYNWQISAQTLIEVFEQVCII